MSLCDGSAMLEKLAVAVVKGYLLSHPSWITGRSPHDPHCSVDTEVTPQIQCMASCRKSRGWMKEALGGGTDV